MRGILPVNHKNYHKFTATRYNLMKFIKRLSPWLRFAIPLILITIGIIINIYAFILFIKPKPPIVSPTPTPTISHPSPIPSVTPSSITPSGAANLGHFPYAEGDVNKMIVIGSYAQQEYQRYEKLAPEAALALMKLIYAARDEGVWIIPVSGFRTITNQEKLFKAQIQRLGSPEAAAKVSAPPGYSEHHTGYAIDLADGNFPKQDITDKFAETDAFKWLKIHGKEFGFEMSFPENNPQGVSYEAWHWRFVGSPAAQAIFKRKYPRMG